MKNFTLLLLCAISLQAQAQLWEVADQRGEEIFLGGALAIGGNRWAVMGSISFGNHLISVRNADGTVAWERSSEYGTGTTQGLDEGRVLLMPDSGLLHIGLGDYCDVIGYARIRRYSADGTMVWEKHIEPQSSYPPSMADTDPLGRIVIASWDSVGFMDLNGDPLGGFEYPSSDIMRLAWASDTTLFLVRGTSLQVTDLAGAPLASTPIGPTVRDMHWDGQVLYVLKGDSIRTFNSALQSQGGEPLPGAAWNSKFITSGNGLFANTSTGLYSVGAGGVSTLVFAWPALPNHATTGCAVRDGLVLSVGITGISGRSTGIVRTLSMQGEAVEHTQDVEVLLEVDSAWAGYAGGYYYSWDRKADITGRVVNHGPDTLDNVVLSMWVQIPFMLCEPPVNRVAPGGLDLAPGDTVALPFGIVYVARGLSQSQAENTTGEICIVALAPDHLADRHPGDNTACRTVEFVLGMNGAEERAPLRIHPNPASDMLTVTGLQALGGPVVLRVADMTGRTWLERSVAGQTGGADLDVSSLPPAAYVVTAQGRGARSVGRLLVVR